MQVIDELSSYSVTLKTSVLILLSCNNYRYSLTSTLQILGVIYI